ncbi:hypothetical protein BKA70DRAFT_1248226 [Coprinopsis sp. MPI-PUGE-AT-0042]|nr:hypothetical protein BKA70DRAFT_1248226 [Coprinopsis sp. MPI-PUGE-AT-0042]
MHPTALRLVRVIPRAAITTPQPQIIPRPRPQYEDLKKPTILQLLEKQKEDAGDSWPANIRIERVVKKEELKNVKPELRGAFKKMLKET